MDNLPSPTSDPTGLAATVVAFATVAFVAVDPSGALGKRWGPVVIGGIALVSILGARLKAWSPKAHFEAVHQARELARAQALKEWETAPPPALKKNAARKAPRKGGRAGG